MSISSEALQPLTPQPVQLIEAQAAAESFEVENFLVTNGIESLRGRPVAGHDGELMPLEEALVNCLAARNSIEAAIDMARTTGSDDILTPMTRYLDKLSTQAQSAEVKKK